jgi:hypothetical protein
MLSHVRGSPKRWFKPRPVTSGLSKLRTCHKRSRRAMCGRLRGWQEESSLCSVDVPEAELGYRAATPQERTHDD